MSVGDQVRKVLFMSGLMSTALSLILDAHFATDAGPPVPVPGPGALALLAVGGVFVAAVALTRRRKK